MKNTVLSLKKEGSMRKMLILCVIAIFFVFCSIGVYAEEVKTKVDPEKFKKLTPEQKEKFKKDMEKARDTALESAKTHNEVAKTAEIIEKVKEVLQKAGEAAQNALSKTEPDLKDLYELGKKHGEKLREKKAKKEKKKK
jgi:capsular polysaccharide biosynthesis protein